MPYKIINNKIWATQDTGEVMEYDATYTDKDGKELITKVNVPIYTTAEYSPDPAQQVAENIRYDLDQKKIEINNLIAQYNAKVAEITELASDLPELGLSEIQALKKV